MHVVAPSQKFIISAFPDEAALSKSIMASQKKKDFEDSLKMAAAAMKLSNQLKLSNQYQPHTYVTEYEPTYTPKKHFPKPPTPKGRRLILPPAETAEK